MEVGACGWVLWQHPGLGPFQLCVGLPPLPCVPLECFQVGARLGFPAGCFPGVLRTPWQPAEGPRVWDLLAAPLSLQIFENKGAMMGCSNPHPHCQVRLSHLDLTVSPRG